MAFTWGNIAQVFRDDARHAQFQREGYVVVDFLEAEDLKNVSKVYQRHHPEPEPGFFTTTFNQDVAQRTQVHNDIRSTIAHRVDHFFRDHKIYFCSFISKAPGPKSELILHQDMSLVDESRFNGINIWCPLVDLTPENGAIQLLPRSHRLYPTYRGASLPDIYDGVEQAVKDRMQSLYLRAGQAVIFDQSIMHYSPPNLSDHVRPVINTFVTHQDAEIVICWTNKEEMPGEVELFREPEDFMLRYQNFGSDIFNRPSLGESIGQTPYEFPQVTEALLEEVYGKIAPAVPVEPVVPATGGFFQRIWQKIKS